MTHPALQLDDVVHQRVRLGILAVLAEAKRADFGFLRDALDLSDGNLSRHIQVLEEAAHLGLGDPPRALGSRRRAELAARTDLAGGRQAIAFAPWQSSGP